MDKKKRGISKVKSIINEIAYDLGIDKKLVRQVLLLTFKELVSLRGGYIHEDGISDGSTDLTGVSAP